MSVGVPQPGQAVRVRSRQYLVEDVVPPPNPADQTLVRLSCLDDDAQGQELEVLWEKEVDARVVSDEAWRAVGKKGFDEPRLFAAWLNTLRWNCVTSTDPRLFQSPWRAVRGGGRQPASAWRSRSRLKRTHPSDPGPPARGDGEDQGGSRRLWQPQ
jgi:hypothetical protein